MNVWFFVRFAFIPGTVGLALWFSMMAWLRNRNFSPDGVRKKDERRLTDDLLGKQVEYHNLATYRALEFYVKVLLSVLGGLGYVALSKNTSDRVVRLLIDASGWIVVAVSFLFCTMVFAHQKAKIERWRFAYKFLSPLTWNETWFFVTGFVMAFASRGLINLLLQ